MDINQRVYNGDQARLVLENEAFQLAMDQIKTELREQWEKSPARDQEGREKLYQLLRLAIKLETTLKTTLETGQLARQELDFNQKTLLQQAKKVVGL